MAKYTVEIGAKVIKLLHEKGYQNAKLIGSLGAGKESEHDIDVFIPITNPKIKRKCVNDLAKIFQAQYYCGTDWGGVYFTNTIFGDIDLFFSTDDFDYGIK